MASFFLDTHVVWWLLNNDSQLDESLRSDIEYPSGHQYCTSEFAILELIHLNQLGKIKIFGGAAELLSLLNDMNVNLDLVSNDVFKTLDTLPILTINGNRHTDMMDRIIIAHCITSRQTLISHDRKFPFYREFGLNLIET